MKYIHTLTAARRAIDNGYIIAYPTESVYGLGCDPFNQQAVLQLLALKQRNIDQGLIILIATWDQLFHLTQSVSKHLLDTVKATWPGHITWLFPKSDIIPEYVSGAHNSIAIRMTAHPIAHALCESGPIISTSANISGQAPAKDIQTLTAQFKQQLYGVLSGNLGNAAQPSAIYDVLTQRCIRKGSI